MPTRLVFDLEANGFVYEATNLWCICAKDLSTRESFQFYESSLLDGLDLLGSYDLLVGHNIMGYDIPLLQKLYPSFTYKGARDTLCMSKLFNPERLRGHSLESYGTQFGIEKPAHNDWTRFSQEMLHRCTEDVAINVMLYNYLVDKYCTNWQWLDPLLLEQEFSYYQTLQELEGVDINVELAYELVDRIDLEVAELDKVLLDRIPKKLVQVGATVSKPFKKDGTYCQRVLDFLGTI